MSPRQKLAPAGFLVLCILMNLSTGVHCGRRPERVIHHQQMQNFQHLRWERDSTVLVMAGNGDFFTHAIQLPKGRYSMGFRADGTIANQELPHLVIRIGGHLIRALVIEEKVHPYTVNFELPAAINEPIQFSFDNDFSSPTEDRNVFLYFPIVIKPFSVF